MLLNYEVEGYKIFDEKISFSMLSNNKIKQLKENVVIKNALVDDISILKSSIVYGPNNSGKTTFIDSIELFKKIIEKESVKEISKNNLNFNFFDDNKKISYKIEFLINNNYYSYSLSFNSEGNILREILFKNKNQILDRFGKNENDIQNVIDLLGHYKDKLLVLSLPKKYKDTYADLSSFFEKLVVLKYKEKNFEEVVNIINNPKYKEDFLKIIKNSGTNIKSIDYKNGHNDKGNSENQFKIESTYEKNGKIVSYPSLLVDSQGTKKLITYASYILKALKEDKILIVDELDSSWHSILTKNIFALFNSKSNEDSQLIASCHDLILLDDQKMFRKDQIWFSYNDKQKTYFYSLNDFKSNKNIKTNALENYLKGKYGALPYPNIGGIFDDK